MWVRHGERGRCRGAGRRPRRRGDAAQADRRGRAGVPISSGGAVLTPSVGSRRAPGGRRRRGDRDFGVDARRWRRPGQTPSGPPRPSRARCGGLVSARGEAASSECGRVSARCGLLGAAAPRAAGVRVAHARPRRWAGNAASGADDAAPARPTIAGRAGERQRPGEFGSRLTRRRLAERFGYGAAAVRRPLHLARPNCRHRR